MKVSSGPRGADGRFGLGVTWASRVPGASLWRAPDAVVDRGQRRT